MNVRKPVFPMDVEPYKELVSLLAPMLHRWIQFSPVGITGTFSLIQT
jgi:hypothetical protein